MICCYNLYTMQKNLYNLSNPKKEITEHDPKKVITWTIVVLLIVLGGIFVYKKFINKEPTLEEKMELLNAVQTEKTEVSKEKNIEILESITNNSNQDTYSEEQKLDILNNL